MTTNAISTSGQVQRRSQWGDLTGWADTMAGSRMHGPMHEKWPLTLTDGDFPPGVDTKDLGIDVSKRRLNIHGTRTVKENNGIAAVLGAHLRELYL